MRFPHFDFYPGDWVHDANNRYLSLTAKGAHIELLCLMWNASSDEVFGLLDDDRGISRALGISLEEWQALRAELVEGPYAVLQVDGDRLVSPRLKKEWEKVRELSQKARANRLQRRSNGRSTTVERSLNDRTYDRTTSHLSSVTCQDDQETHIDARPRAREMPVSPDVVEEFLTWFPPLEPLRPQLLGFPDAALTRSVGDQLARFLAQGTAPEILARALQEALDRGKGIAYALSILRSYLADGIRTLEDYDRVRTPLRLRTPATHGGRDPPPAAESGPSDVTGGGGVTHERTRHLQQPTHPRRHGDPRALDEIVVPARPRA